MKNLRENINEGLSSIKANLLRSILTALIVAIGITSLVGILTAIDGIQASINESFSSLGVNSFEIRSKNQSRGRRRGISDKTYPDINFKEAKRFKELYEFPSNISVSTYVTGIAEIKRLSKMTNPNVRVIGANENFMIIESLDIKSGRNFSNIEIQYGSNVAIIGPDVVEVLFEDNEDPLNVLITVLGTKFKIIGVLKDRSLGGGSGPNRSVFIPVQTATNLAGGRALRFSIDVDIANPMDMEYAMGEATGLMRSIRRDGLGRESSFEIKRNQSLEEELEEISSYLRVGGFGIGFITLLGASIGLMNIMMVSVTERTKEIGIRKALGATPMKIRQQFLIEAIVVCQLGGILGIILGIGIGNLVSSLIASGSFMVPWFWMFIAFAIGMVVGLASGYYPAYKASKMDPIESLRFE